MTGNKNKSVNMCANRQMEENICNKGHMRCTVHIVGDEAEMYIFVPGWKNRLINVRYLKFSGF
jgi:hypothetical protein